MKTGILILALLGSASSAMAQDLLSDEIIVTAQRREQDEYDSVMPSVGLRRSADFLVQEVIIRGDTRDADQREREIRSMLEKAVRLASQNGIQLAYGDYILTPITLENIDELELQKDNRPDSERINFLIKAPLSETQRGKDAQARLKRYIEAVPEVGRAQMDDWGEATLSVVGPDSYRQQIAAKIAEDARNMASQVGDGYGVEIEGLNMPVQWARSGLSEVFLYIPYRLTIIPKH